MVIMTYAVPLFRYIQTWKAERGDQPSINESMDTSGEDNFASAGSTSTPKTATVAAEEKMETDDQATTTNKVGKKEAEKKNKSPPPNNNRKGGKPKRKRMNIKLTS